MGEKNEGKKEAAVCLSHSLFFVVELVCVGRLLQNGDCAAVGRSRGTKATFKAISIGYS